MPRCENCGRRVSRAANFCQNCGVPVNVPASAEEELFTPDAPPVTAPRQPAPMQPTAQAAPVQSPVRPPVQPAPMQPPVQAAADIPEDPVQPEAAPERETQAEPRWRHRKRSTRDEALMDLFDEEEGSPDDEAAEFLAAPEQIAKRRKTGLVLGVALGLLGLAALIVFLGLPFLQTANSPYLGSWQAVTGVYSGFTYQAGEMLGENTLTLQLEPGGMATLTVGGYTEKLSWRPETNGIRITGSRVFRILEGGSSVLTGEYGATGVILTLGRG